MPCGVQVSVLYMCVNGVGERRDVGDGDGPLIGVETCGFAGQACGVRVPGSNLVLGFCHGDQSGPSAFVRANELLWLSVGLLTDRFRGKARRSFVVESL